MGTKPDKGPNCFSSVLKNAILNNLLKYLFDYYKKTYSELDTPRTINFY